MRRGVLAALCVVGCGHGTPAARPPGDDVAATDGDDAVGASDDQGRDDGDGSTEPPEVLAERIAAVQWSMGQLENAAHLCWAAAAVDDFHVGGAFTATLTFAAPVASAPPTVRVDRDEPGDPVLTPCLVQALQAFRWPPPLAGEVVQLPFEFQVPKAQYVIDRAMVPAAPTGGARRLITAANTGQGAVDLIEEALVAGVGIMPAAPTAWLVLTGAKVAIGGRVVTVVPGDVFATAAGAKVTSEPGGTAATATGVLLGVSLNTSTWAPHAGAPPFIARAKDAKVFPRTGGSARMLLDPTRVKGGPDVAVVDQTFEAGTAAPTHTHPGTELIYVTAGRGTTTIAGVTVDVGPTSVIVIPPGVEHSFSVIDELHAIQVYTPAGPEQRFKAAAP